MADLGLILQQQSLSRIRMQQQAARERTAEEARQFDIQQANRNHKQHKNPSAFQRGGEGAAAIPAEFARNVGLFRAGGQFGEGGKAEVERGGQQAISAGQMGLAQTGMSSGTNVAGLRARVLADTALARKKISDERITRLGGALTQAGTAKLSAAEIAARERMAFINTLGSLR